MEKGLNDEGEEVELVEGMKIKTEKEGEGIGYRK